MKYIKTYENNKVVAFERTLEISAEKKILNIIKVLKYKNIEFTTYYSKQDTNWEFIKIYGLSNKTNTLKKLGFNLLPTSYNFTWKWEPIKDIEIFLSTKKYNI
jgi:hypothetical protein